jgi:hypothetical protein
MKTTAAFIAFCLCVLLAAGCSPAGDTNPPELRSETATITLTPVNLFEGDKAKFRPFLGNMAGAFKMRYDGQKPNVRLAVEIWENGKKTNTGWSMEDLFFSENGNAENREIEVIVAMDTTYGDEGREAIYTVKVGTVHDNGTSMTSNSLQLEPMSFMQLSYSEPQTFAAENAVHVFGFQGSRSGIIRPVSLTPEGLSQIEWGFIVTLYFDEK